MISIYNDDKKVKILCGYISDRKRPSLIVKDGACLISVAQFHSEKAMRDFTEALAEILDVKIDEVKEKQNV